MSNIDEILLELSYRVESGIVDLTKTEQVQILEQVLQENGIENANEVAQKARVYFSYLNETITEAEKTGQSKAYKGYFHRGGGYYSKSKDGEITHKSDKGSKSLRPLSKVEKDKVNKKLGAPAPKPTKGGKALGATDFLSGAEKKKKTTDTQKTAAINVKSDRYGTKGSKDLDQKKAGSRLKYLPKSKISTAKALTEFKRKYPKAITTKFEFPKSSNKLLKAMLPPAGYDALKSLLKMSKQGDFEPPISMVTDQYGQGKISAQANELAMQAVFCFPDSEKGKMARQEFINSMLKNADAIEAKGGVPILDKTWITHMENAHDAFITNMNRIHGKGNWQTTGATWDVRQQQESLGANYDEKGDSTDINIQIKIKGKISNVEVSCKKDWNIFLLNAGLGDASNWFYTLGSKLESRANDLLRMKEAKDPAFGKEQENELKELAAKSLLKAPIKNSELQDSQIKSAKKGLSIIKEIPNKDFSSTIKDCMSRGKNDPLSMDKNEAELATRVQKFLNKTNKLDEKEFANYIGGGSKAFKKAIMVYHKLMGAYTGDTKWLQSHKKITYQFVETAAKKMATNKDFQGMLLRKLQEAIPVKTMVEGVENMQIDGMYITQKHMQEMFGTDKWDSIKEYLGIKVVKGVASLTYSAKGKNQKPLKIADIQMREKGVGYNGAVALECVPSKDFEISCKEVDNKINKRK